MLKEKLDEMAQASAKKIPAEALVVIKQATQAVADSIPTRSIPKPGEAVPSFKLPDSKGNEHDSNELIGQGHLVVSFFRGSW